MASSSCSLGWVLCIGAEKRIAPIYKDVTLLVVVPLAALSVVVALYSQDLLPSAKLIEMSAGLSLSTISKIVYHADLGAAIN